MKDSHSNQSPFQPPTYVPSVGIIRATLRFSSNRVPISLSSNPEQICGEARRIGYTGTQDHDLAIYRLKIRLGQGHPTVTLPGLYIIEGGIFQEYEQWQQKQ
jgi:hypothetical protein